MDTNETNPNLNSTYNQHYYKTIQKHNMLALLDWGQIITLLRNKPFPHLSNKLINLLLVRKSLGHTLLLQAPLSPRNNLGALRLYVDIA